MAINKQRLSIRRQVKKRKPDFVRPESWRYDRLKKRWKKPKGVDHHQRKQKSRGRPGLVKIGYGGPRIAKYLHPSGYTDNLVYRTEDLAGLDPKTDGIRLGHSVGTRKRIQIITAAMKKRFKIFNGRVDIHAD
ncbi:MAG: 50S ribosomal protein L32e [Cenarchaeum sp. SB0665_bin_23]|nr:50S ribosomal protein L32e [Cenarchaeum sp. SB0665_bin_23]MYG33164.1 50S ribosomal protein L32e [Cenarchaeum sp. SB0677_bin_16]